MRMAWLTLAFLCSRFCPCFAPKPVLPKSLQWITRTLSTWPARISSRTASTGSSRMPSYLIHLKIAKAKSKSSCIRGKVEEIQLPVKQVDIIVSEWMGYCLLYEAMLDSVLYARDKYLAPDGLMVPSECKLLIAGMHDSDYMNDSVHFWNNVYGFRMASMKDRVRGDVGISHLKPTSLATEPVTFLDLPLHTIKTGELVFTKSFEMEVKENVESLDAFVIYFDNFFSRSRNVNVGEKARADPDLWKGEGVAFTTGPGGKETHWRQGILMIQDGGGLLNQGQKIAGDVTYRKSKDNSRELEIEVSWEAVGKSKKRKQLWHMR